jgi:hypothetical protein
MDNPLMLNEQLKEYLDSLPDWMLYQYATDTEAGYSEEAMAYANTLLANKHLTAEQLADLLLHGVAREVAVKEYVRHELREETKEPLSLGGKLLFLLIGLCWLWPVLVVIWGWHKDGKHRKAWAALLAFCAGCAVTAILLVVLL